MGAVKIRIKCKLLTLQKKHCQQIHIYCNFLGIFSAFVLYKFLHVKLI
jgi:hypothetical protein